jgi:hypothetical protein
MEKAVIDPRDTVDIPDERELDDHIPDAVCDVQTYAGDVLGPDVVRSIHDWIVERRRVSAIEANGPPWPDPDEWQASDDDAAEIVTSIAALFEIDPPWPEDALDFDECEAAGVDGTLRTIGEP